MKKMRKAYGLKPWLLAGGFAFILLSATALKADTGTGKESYRVFRGVNHVHSRFSHDSKAKLEYIAEVAGEEEVDFVVITDHNDRRGARFYERLRSTLGPHPLLLFGEEISTADGHLLSYGAGQHPAELKDSQALIDWIHTQGGYAVFAHALSPKNPWENWDLKNWDGFEIYDFGHHLIQGNLVDFAVRSLYEDESSLLNTSQDIPRENLAFLDAQLQKRPSAVLAGAEAHLKRDKDNFIMAFKSVTLYVLARELNQKEIFEALGKGRLSIVFESRGRASEFSFEARAGGRTFFMGESFALTSDAVLEVRVPVRSQIRLIHNGTAVRDEEAEGLTFALRQEGVYRVEVYRDQKPWIFSNPIYVGSGRVE